MGEREIWIKVDCDGKKRSEKRFFPVKRSSGIGLQTTRASTVSGNKKDEAASAAESNTMTQDATSGQKKIYFKDICGVKMRQMLHLNNL